MESTETIGFDEVTLIPQDGRDLRIRASFRANLSGNVETIQMDVLVAAGDRSILTLQSELIARAKFLLDRFLAERRQET